MGLFTQHTETTEEEKLEISIIVLIIIAVIDY